MSTVCLVYAVGFNLILGVLVGLLVVVIPWFIDDSQ